MAIWIILAILGLLAALPLGVRVEYDSLGARVWVLAGPLHIKLFPWKRAEKPENIREKPKKKPAKQKTGKPEPAPKGGAVKDLQPFVSMAIDFLGDFRKKLRVKRVELNLVLAGDDPCDLGETYGKAWAVLGNLWPRLEEWFVIKKRDVQIQCDFTATQTLITARLDMTVTLGAMTALICRYGIRAFKELSKRKYKSKGGAKL